MEKASELSDEAKPDLPLLSGGQVAGATTAQTRFVAARLAGRDYIYFTAHVKGREVARSPVDGQGGENQEGELQKSLCCTVGRL